MRRWTARTGVERSDLRPLLRTSGMFDSECLTKELRLHRGLLARWALDSSIS